LVQTESTDTHYLEKPATLSGKPRPLKSKHADQQRKEQPQKNPHKAGFLAGPTSEKSPMANLNVVPETGIVPTRKSMKS
jgi:hypothetical protein